MSMQLIPYLTFPGNAEEAMRFYADVLGGEVSITTFKEFGMGHAGRQATTCRSACRATTPTRCVGCGTG